MTLPAIGSRITSGKHVARNPEALAWWDSLGETEWPRVVAWCRENRPPADFDGTLVDWAFAKLPKLGELT